MFYILETDTQLNRIKSLARLGGYVDIISSNNNYHPKLSFTVAIYIRPINSKHGFILPIQHDECLNIDKERVSDILNSFTTLYTLDKKNLLYHFNIQHATDISLLYSMTHYDRIDYSRENNTLNSFYNKFSDKTNINQFIPISKLYESCEKVYDKVKEHIAIEIPSGFNFYNNIATNVFFLIEQTGLGINLEDFINKFTPRNSHYNINNETVYTSYNLYNATSRPTNAFNSVNFAAIPKGEEYRNSFKPTNDYFVELDFDGYHLRLLCEQIGFEIPSTSAHKYLAKMYFDKEDITEEEYNNAKQINFQAIYGKIPEEHKNLSIFKKIQSYIDNMWKTFTEVGYVSNPLSDKPFTKKLKEMHPAKLMNYMMQSLETARNILILKEVLGYLRDKDTKIALYTYDAILFDFSTKDGKETLKGIQKIMESNEKYPVKFKYSKSLNLQD